MKRWIMWTLWWRIWLDAPYCSGNCNQSRKPCNCKTGKGE